ncbi:hypothetical protein NMY22_g9509 [Coprinellus aureogranulatus]|nr:hypothetical protein NMY22_g9509 [Coprinellus aureogranulatus]
MPRVLASLLRLLFTSVSIQFSFSSLESPPDSSSPYVPPPLFLVSFSYMMPFFVNYPPLSRLIILILNLSLSEWFSASPSAFLSVFYPGLCLVFFVHVPFLRFSSSPIVFHSPSSSSFVLCASSPLSSPFLESKLQLPKTKDRPAVLPEPFQPGSGHALDLPLFGRSTLTPKHIGQATPFPASATNASKVFSLPNKMFLEYRILSSPTSIIRPITLTLTSTLSSAKGSSSADSRLVLHGRAGSGKSYALHQAVQYAQAEGWVVVYVPRAVTLVKSTNSYIYDIRTQTYLQPNASYRLLNHIHAANASLLSKIPLKNSFATEKLTVEAGEGKTLADLAQAGLKDKSQQSAPLVLDALLKGLEEQKDVPVLAAVYDFQSLFHDSAYRGPFFQPIKPHHLSPPRTLLEYSSGSRVLTNGVFLGAVTESDTTYTVPVELQDAVQASSDAGGEAGQGVRRKMGSEYVKRDEVREGYVRGVKGVEVPERMTLGEMAGLFGVWKEDMALTTDKYDELFMSKYVESDGNPRDFVWKGLLATMTP